MENEKGKIYDTLMEISTKMGKFEVSIDTIQTNLEEIKSDIQANYVSSEEADRRADAKLERYFQQTKDRQDSIRDSLIKIIAEDQQRIQVLEEWKKDSTSHETRLQSLEAWKKECTGRLGKSIIYWLTKARDYIIWAAILALLASAFASFKALFSSLQAPPEKPAAILPAESAQQAPKTQATATNAINVKGA